MAKRRTILVPAAHTLVLLSSSIGKRKEELGVRKKWMGLEPMRSPCQRLLHFFPLFPRRRAAPPDHKGGEGHILGPTDNKNAVGP
jgi:hypothetical protein